MRRSGERRREEGVDEDNEKEEIRNKEQVDYGKEKQKELK